MAKGFKTGGRVAGTPNKATAELKALAQEHGPAAVAKLRHLMENAASEQAQIAAANALLDRGYGKAAQTVIGDSDEDPINVVATIKRVIVGTGNPDSSGVPPAAGGGAV